MFCMRFDVVCFWWLKQKYCFFTTHTPNTFRKSLLCFSWCCGYCCVFFSYPAPSLVHIFHSFSLCTPLAHTEKLVVFCKTMNIQHGVSNVCALYILFRSVFGCALLCIRHIVTWAIEFLVSHYKQLFSVNNRAVVTDMYRICAVIYGICMQICKRVCVWKECRTNVSVWTKANIRPHSIYARMQCVEKSTLFLIDPKNQMLPLLSVVVSFCWIRCHAIA